MSSRSETSLKDTKYVPECLKWMLIAAAILIAIGAMNVYNATYYMNMAAGDGPYTHFLKHVGVLALSLASSWLGCRKDSSAVGLSYGSDSPWCCSSSLL